MSPTVSVIMPTYNRWPRLQRALAALAGQTVSARDIEIIVVSDGSTDETDDNLHAGRAPVEVVFHRQENSGPAVARNTGLGLASADLVLFIDDDVVALPHCVAAHLRTHESGPGRQVVVGPLLSPPDHRFSPWVQWEQDKLEQQYEAMRRGDWSATPRQFYTGNASVARGEIDAVGGFDPTYLRAEDIELAYRMERNGASFVFDDRAGAHHYAERSYESWLSNAGAYGRNDARMWRDGDVGWLLPVLLAEYRERNALVRAHTEIGLRLPIVRKIGEFAAKATAVTALRLGVRRPQQRLLSAVYNLTYYRALLAELGCSNTDLLTNPESIRCHTGEGTIDPLA